MRWRCWVSLRSMRRGPSWSTRAACSTAYGDLTRPWRAVVSSSPINPRPVGIAELKLVSAKIYKLGLCLASTPFIGVLYHGSRQDYWSGSIGRAGITVCWLRFLRCGLRLGDVGRLSISRGHIFPIIPATRSAERHFPCCIDMRTGSTSLQMPQLIRPFRSDLISLYETRSTDHDPGKRPVKTQ